MVSGYGDPDLGDTLVEAPGWVSLRSSLLRVISLDALKKRGIRSLGANHAWSQVDGFCRNLFLRSPVDAQVAFRRTPERYCLRPDNSPARVGR